ncbi:uncharacterized protein E0L32_012141 [Thyridium curvatum]|uniref:Uncharacterized protein n=1 Tax=Thyridium curvatum TaxID=1093900 RepID=A0A507BLK1_9PEZI|nr:uncharacterized protein E0L32_012141 [Thyridium curvatum]TPX17548.1 hypothetical protein E0L32_012141 [Thyridium curvatum]
MPPTKSNKEQSLGFSVETFLQSSPPPIEISPSLDLASSPPRRSDHEVEDLCVTYQAGTKIPITVLYHYLNIYHEQLYVIWPVVNKDVVLARLHNTDDQVIYTLAASVCAATLAQLNIVNETDSMLHHLMAREAENIRAMVDYSRHHFIDALLTSFFLHVFYTNTGKLTKSTLLLREAIAYAHILGLHQDAFYTDLDPDAAQAHSLQHDIPPTFKLSPALPEIQSSLNFGLGPAFYTLCKLFQCFDNACPAELRPGQHSSLQAISTELCRTHPLPVCKNEVQRADIVVTESWLRVVLWKSAIPYIDATTDPVDQGLSVSFPMSVGRDLLSNLTTLSSFALEAHGPGMMSKLFEVANTVADVMICAPDLTHVGNMHVGSRDILWALSSVLESLRATGNPALLTVLREKVAACALDQIGSPRMLRITDVSDEATPDQEDGMYWDGL